MHKRSQNIRLHRHLINGIAEALNDIFGKAEFADKVVDRYLRMHPKWGARDRRFFAEGVYESVRWWRRLWFAADLDPEKYLDPDFMNVSVCEKVWYAWYMIHNPSQSIVDFKEKFKKDPQVLWSQVQIRKVRESLPDWLDERAETEIKQDWNSTLSALNKPALVYLRTNLIKTNTKTIIEDLLKEGIIAKPVDGSSDTLFLPERKNVFVTQAFKKGFFEVQDLGSQKIVPFLDPKPGMRVIDACAGGGGKSIHMASVMNNKGKVIALDKNDWRLNPLRQRAARAGADIIETKVITSGKIIKRLLDSADRLLLDVPCSGTGVLRRSPDTKWKLSLEELLHLIEVQQEILQSYCAMTKIGGIMVYSTCSVFPSENEEQIKLFLKSKSGENWQFLEEIHISPENSDGFYMAKLKRIS